METSYHIVRIGRAAYVVQRTRKIKIFWKLYRYEKRYLDAEILKDIPILAWWSDYELFCTFKSLEDARLAYSKFKIHPQRDNEFTGTKVIEQLD